MNGLLFNKFEVAGILNKIAKFSVGFGVLLRLIQFAHNRALWFDEALLAINLTNRNFIQLTQPLDPFQVAPIGFLFIQKLMIVVLGNKDYILRLFPLVVGIAAIILMYKIAFDNLSEFGALIAVVFFTFSPRLIYYASENKQYSSDVFFTLLLLFFAYRCLNNEVKPRDFIILAITGAISFWFSHPASFLVAGIGIVMALDMLLKKKQNSLFWLGFLFFLWVGNFGLQFLIFLGSLTKNESLVNFWQAGFMPMPPWKDPTWIPNAFLTMFSNPMGFNLLSVRIIAFALLLIGSLSFPFRKWQSALLITLPFPLLIAASGLEKYPFYDRLILFLAPLAFLLVSEGLDRIRSLLINLKVNSWTALIVGLCFAGFILYSPTVQAIRNIWEPNLMEHIKPVLAHLKQHKQDTDLIYVYYGAVPAFKYYAPFYGFQPNDYVLGNISRGEPDKYLEELDSLISDGRAWIIFSHNCSWCIVNEEEFIIQHLDKLGHRVDESRAPGVSIYLYDF